MKTWLILNKRRFSRVTRNVCKTAIATILLLMLPGCVTANYGNPFLGISYSEKSSIDSDDFVQLLEKYRETSQQQEIDRLVTSSLIDGRYLPIVANATGTVQFSFDPRMNGLEVRYIFATGSRLWERKLLGTYSMGYVPFRFTQGYFWVHLIVEPLEKDTLLLQLEPEGERMYGYNNPVF